MELLDHLNYINSSSNSLPEQIAQSINRVNDQVKKYQSDPYFNNLDKQ